MEVESAQIGLFGPNSMVWRIHSDPAGWVGGIRALLLQALQPRAMAGVVQFSDFYRDPWLRFRNTSEFLMTIAFKPRAEVVDAIERVRKIHESVVGVDPYTKDEFSANDPYLLAYIHNCLVDSMLCAYTKLTSRLTSSQRNRYLGEMSEIAVMIGADRKYLPVRSEELSEWLGSQSGLMVTQEARTGAEAVLNLNVPGLLRPLWIVARNASIALLPDYARELYGFDSPPCAAQFYEGAASVLGRTLKLTLPGHPYYRKAKFAYYDSYSAESRAKHRSIFDLVL